MRFKTSFLITFAFHLMILVLDKGTGLIISKMFSAKDQVATRGDLVLLTNLPFILMAISNLGLATSLVYFAQRKEVTVRVAGETTSFVATAWGSFVSLAAVGVIAVWATTDSTADFPPLALLVPLLLTPIFLLLISYRNSIQLVLHKIYAYNVTQLIPSVVFLPLFLLLYFVITDRDPHESAVWAICIPAIFVALGLSWILRKHVPLRPRFHRGFLRKALAYGWRANVSSTLGYLNHRVDLYLLPLVYMVSVNDARAEVAFYSMAVTLAELIWHFPEALRDLMFAKVASLDEDAARAFTPVVCRNSLWICAAGAAVVWVVHDPLLGLWFADDWGAVWGPKVTPALAWLLPGTLLFTVAKVLRADLMARGFVNQCIFLAGLVLVVMIAGDIALVPQLGATGASLASTIAYGACAIGTVWFYASRTGVPVLKLLIPHREDWQHYRTLLARLRILRNPSED